MIFQNLTFIERDIQKKQDDIQHTIYDTRRRTTFDTHDVERHSTHGIRHTTPDDIQHTIYEIRRRTAFDTRYTTHDAERHSTHGKRTLRWTTFDTMYTKHDAGRH